jgi:hypothetical protein
MMEPNHCLILGTNGTHCRPTAVQMLCCSRWLADDLKNSPFALFVVAGMSFLPEKIGVPY